MMMRTLCARVVDRLAITLTLLVLAAVPAAAQISAGEHAERRAALAEQVGNGVILAMGSAAPPQDYIPFHQNSPFRFLTGFTEPDAALVMVVEEGRIAEETLFVLPRDPARETWEGYRVGPEGTQGVTGIRGRSIETLPSIVDQLVEGRDAVHVVGGYDARGDVKNDVTQRVDALLEGHPGVEVRAGRAGARDDAAEHVTRLRAVKTEAELELLRKSTAITTEAHHEVMRAIAPGMNEFEIQALVEYTFRRYGSERPAFASIVGSGPNSTILHYNANDRFMEDGDVVVVDIGASYGGYAADITRTLPVNGRFSEAQRAIYQLVRDAQAAAEELAGPGVDRRELSQVAATVLATGLAELGLIEAPDATFETAGGGRQPQLALFYMHGLGHGIGLDVHDPWPVILEPGAAFTIEPGIYVRPNLFDEVVPDTPANRRMIAAIRPAFERYVGIGVRIEDDYIVTEDGLEWISPVPREIEEIEAYMARPWDGPTSRNPEWVEWYRRMR